MKTNDKEQRIKRDTNGFLLENFFKEKYQEITNEEISAQVAKNIDNYFYNMTTFEEFKAACKEVFEVDVTEEDFKNFVREFENTYHTKNKEKE